MAIAVRVDNAKRLRQATLLHGQLERLDMLAKGTHPLWQMRWAERRTEEGRLRLAALRNIRTLFKGFGTPRELGRLGRRLWLNVDTTQKRDPTIVAAMRSIMLQRTRELRVQLAKDTAEVMRETVKVARLSTRMVLIQQKEKAELRRVQRVVKQADFFSGIYGPRLREEMANELVDSVAESLETAFEGYAGDLVNVVVDASNPAHPLTMSQLAKELENDFLGISSQRAMMIARTESARVYGAASLNEMQKLGIEERRWLTAAGSPAAAISPVCPFCVAMAEQGWVSVNEQIEASLMVGIRNSRQQEISGYHPPFHPNCRCDMQANVEDWMPSADDFGDIVHCTSPCDMDEREMLTGKWGDHKELGGGVNKTWKGQVGNMQAVWKTEGKGHQLFWRGGKRIGSELSRERAATLVNKGLGNLVRMPKVVIRESKKFGRIAVQQYIPNKYNGLLANLSELQTAAANDIAVFDAVIGNLDRHLGNVLITDSGELIAIDHGLAFPAHGARTRTVQWSKSVFVEGQQMGVFGTLEGAGGKQLTSSARTALNHLVESRAVLEPQLIELIGQRANDLMWQRVDMLIIRGRVPTVMEFESFLLGKL